MILWHHDVHAHLGQSLVYFQLSFSPVYRRKEISDAIRDCLAERHVRSYCIYETYGLYDIMIRVWLPRDTPGPTFTTLLKERLHNLGCTRVLPFFVSEQIHHWGWWDQQLRRPKKNDVASLSPGVIQRVENDEPTDLVHSLRHQDLLRPYEKKNKGIKFFVVIPSPMPGFAPTEEMDETICRRVQRFLVSAKRILAPSFYIGDGFARFLIKAKFAFNDYHAIDDFVDQINALGADGFAIRTYTYLATGSSDPFTVEQESLVETIPQTTTQPLDGHAYLARPEGNEFEVKASLRADIQRLINEPSQPLSQNPKLAIEGVVKSIAAFLNTNGGELLIGALEAPRFSKQLEAKNPVLVNLPRIGDWLICGLDYEYQSTKNFDGFCLILGELVREHIGAVASVLISIELVKIADRELALVRVPQGLGSYYVDKVKFYVRNSGSSVPLEGTDRELYQERSQKIAKH